MSAEVFPVFNPSVPAASFNGDGKLLLQEHELLDEIALALNLKPFTAFGDTREIPEDFDGDADDLDELLGEWNEWFSIEEGLETIEGLADFIESDPDINHQIEQADLVLSDLRELVNCLRTASLKNARFRFEIG